MAGGNQSGASDETDTGVTIAPASGSGHGSTPPTSSAEPLLLRTKSESSLKPADYFNYEFSDQEKWRPFVVSRPDLQEPLYLYVVRDSEEAEQLAALNFKKPQRITLSIRPVENSHTHGQFEITKVLGQGWVIK